MDEKFEIWNVLHDGRIKSIQGLVPGDLEFFIHIPYLANQFSAQNKAFKVKLKNCKYIEFEKWGDAKKTPILNEILTASPEILSTRSNSFPVEIVTSNGVLYLSYDSISIELDTGKVVSFEELNEKSIKYWDLLGGKLEENRPPNTKKPPK